MSIRIRRLLVGIGAILLLIARGPFDPNQEYVTADITIAIMIAVAALSLAASILLRPKPETPVQADKPATLSSRGSFANYFVDIRRVGPVVTWVGDEIIKEESTGGGKGFGSAPETDVYYEAGMHVLGVGPCTCLYQILQSGAVILNGPITPESHPSGSTIDLGKEGSFSIFWGEGDQPVNTFLGDAGRIGVSSRWPFFCYVVWNRKRKGTARQWPILDYVIERKPSNHSAILPGSVAWHEATQTLDGPVRAIFDSVADADPDTGYLELEKNRSSEFKPKENVEIVGNGIGDGTYTLRRVEVVLVTVGTTPSGFPIKETRTRLFLQEGTLGADDNGTAQSYSLGTDSGSNIAHVIAEILFAPFPQGLGMNPNGPEPWDTASLDALGQEADTNGWRSSIFGNGETATSLLANILQDHGTLLPFEVTLGKLRFQRVREPAGTLPNLGDRIFVNEFPVERLDLGERPIDKIVYLFTDRTLQFSDATVSIDEDGQATYLEHSSAERVPITSTVHFDTAAQLAELRSGEANGGGGDFTLEVSREARELIPGQQIIASGFDEVLVVVSNQIDPLSERVVLGVAPDIYGARKTDFENTPGGGQPTITEPEPDPEFAWMEVPEKLLGSSAPQMLIAVPRIRAHAQIVEAAIHLSRDDVTYTLWGSDRLVQTGGTLVADLEATGPAYVAQGPVYAEEGPDNSSILQDLSADLTNWGLGRQLAVIVSTAGTEICFLQKATIIAAGQRRMDGLLRARYDTRKLLHPAGSPVFIFNPANITPVDDPLLEPAQDLYVKTQPATSGGQVDLSTVPPYGEVLKGKGLVPIKPDFVYLRQPQLGVSVYYTGDDVTVAWCHSSAPAPNATGAGYQSAGEPIGDPVALGDILVELLNLGDVVMASQTVPSSFDQMTWTNSEIVTALGSQISFKFRVSHLANGYASESAIITVAKL